MKINRELAVATTVKAAGAEVPGKGSFGGGIDEYREFIRQKVTLAKDHGIPVEPSAIHPALKPHQRDVVAWACRGGRRAIFASFGLGKTLMQQKGKQMHLCPMQFDIANRVIAQFSMPGETVLDPFSGIGTVPMCAVALGRKAIGIELCRSYFLDGATYTEMAAQKLKSPTLLNLTESAE